MQVLVALAQAHGAIVSRDELICRCWGGIVVGEGSINRAISLLRGASEEIGSGFFRVETVAKVGYRLVLAESDPAGNGAAPVRSPVRRSKLAWAGLAVLLAGAIGAVRGLAALHPKARPTA